MSHVKVVGKIQVAFTVTKIAALLIIIFIGFYNFYSGPVKTEQILHDWFYKYPINYNGLAMAFYNGLFSYSGW